MFSQLSSIKISEELNERIVEDFNIIFFNLPFINELNILNYGYFIIQFSI